MNDNDNIYLITDLSGYPPQISRLLSMMNYARHTTLQSVRGLSTGQLDTLIDKDSNSIGALLLHMAAVEIAYQAQTFEGRDLTEEELAEWGPAGLLQASRRPDECCFVGDCGSNELEGAYRAGMRPFHAFWFNTHIESKYKKLEHPNDLLQELNGEQMNGKVRQDRSISDGGIISNLQFII